MKKKITAAVLTIALCLTLIAGSTFALFTSEDEVNIAITSGEVKVTATINNLTGSSLGEALTPVDGKITFANGGTAVFAPVAGVKTLTLDRVTPGDKVEFTVDIENESTVDVQYRLTWIVDGELKDDLVITANGALNTEWAKWLVSEQNVKTINVSIELPMEFEDQSKKSASISFTVEAVQANAIVEDVATAEQLWAALEMGIDNITLVDDITLADGQVITVEEGVETTINLNGKILTGVSHKNVGAVVMNNGTLTITNGTIRSTAANGGSAIQNRGTLIAENVTLNGASNADGSWPSYTVNNTGEMTINNSAITSVHGAVASYGEGAVLTLNNTDIDMSGIPGFTSHGIYTYNNGKVVVNGGNIINKATDQNSTGASVINGNVYINSGNFTGRIENYYGTPVISGGTFSVKPNARYLAEYYAAYDNQDGTWTVRYAENVSTPSTNEDLQDAITNGKEVVLVQAGNYTFPSGVNSDDVTIICEEGTVFAGTSSLNIGGATVVGATFSNPNGQAVSGTINGTFKDCTFVGGETLRWCYVQAGKTIVFENCVFETTLRGIHFDEMSGDVIFKNCEINGFNAYSGTGTMTFEGCTFGYDASNYNGLNIYTNTVIKNCTFNFVSGKTNFIDMEGTGKTLTITNCTATLDGEAANVADFVGGSKIGQNTVVIG